MRFEFDFYEDFEEFDYFEDLNVVSPFTVRNCIICREPLFITPPAKNPNSEIIDKIVEFLERKNVSRGEIKYIKHLKNLVICRWDLFKLIARLLKNNELKGLFDKIVSFYDFDNFRRILNKKLI